MQVRISLNRMIYYAAGTPPTWTEEAQYMYQTQGYNYRVSDATIVNSDLSVILIIERLAKADGTFNTYVYMVNLNGLDDNIYNIRSCRSYTSEDCANYDNYINKTLVADLNAFNIPQSSSLNFDSIVSGNGHGCDSNEQFIMVGTDNAETEDTIFAYFCLPMTDTYAPSKTPTSQPTTTPSEQPSDYPTSAPTADPTTNPTADPTSEPTAKPTTQAPTTMQPTTDSPTSDPTKTPTADPTSDPTSVPTTAPTADPTPSQIPAELDLQSTSTAGPTTNAPTTAEPSTYSPTTSAPTADPTDLLFSTGICYVRLIHDKNIYFI